MTTQEFLERLAAHVDQERTWLGLYEHLRLGHRMSGSVVPDDLADTERVHVELHMVHAPGSEEP